MAGRSSCCKHAEDGSWSQTFALCVCVCVCVCVCAKASVAWQEGHHAVSTLRTDHDLKWLLSLCVRVHKRACAQWCVHLCMYEYARACASVRACGVWLYIPAELHSCCITFLQHYIPAVLCSCCIMLLLYCAGFPGHGQRGSGSMRKVWATSKKKKKSQNTT